MSLVAGSALEWRGGEVDWGKRRRGEKEKKEEREKEGLRFFGFLKPNFILFSIFRNAISFLRISNHIFDI